MTQLTVFNRSIGFIQSINEHKITRALKAILATSIATAAVSFSGPLLLMTVKMLTMDFWSLTSYYVKPGFGFKNGTESGMGCLFALLFTLYTPIVALSCRMSRYTIQMMTNDSVFTNKIMRIVRLSAFIGFLYLSVVYFPNDILSTHMLDLFESRSAEYNVYSMALPKRSWVELSGRIFQWTFTTMLVGWVYTKLYQYLNRKTMQD